jgi:hypothetical protein
MKINLLLLAAIGLAITLHNLQAGDPNSSTPAESHIDPAKLVVAFTGDRWTTGKVMIATGTLTNNNPMPVIITGISATGFDKQRHVIAGSPGSSANGTDYTIGSAVIDAGATAIFKEGSGVQDQLDL